ncbi:hypothetical protein FW774_01120 (plasmid) [Pedobacter sp. BS3]|uniref:hypothetical protein n=1 Tax=Pedobacter sp. BS3 TaxID=2567937 RepID=UPI0011EEE5E6|nr:hypothetical protein [Pedobacter sp. BS3]TZF85707.1 hypothetical protein FW774_01120 [Pedobacter sp. BS3]
MKTTQKVFTAIFCIMALAFLMEGCKKKNEAQCEGCNNPVVFTIQDSDNRTGYIYKNNIQDNPNVPQFNYGIWFNDTDCIDCVHTFFVCNDAFLNSLGNIPEYPGIKIKFSGQAMKLCKEPFHPADYTYNHIILTKIEKQ